MDHSSPITGKVAQDEAIVVPIKEKNSPDLGPVAVMVSSQSDLRPLCNQMDLDESGSTPLFMSRLYAAKGEENFSVVGPMIGAPYAVMLLETLIAWGARKILFFGWCGAVSRKVKIGDIIVPTGSMIDEGTSRHYLNGAEHLAESSSYVKEKTKEVLNTHGLSFYEGTVWSTDAVYRETGEKVAYYQTQNVLAVEMELSALFTVGKYRGIDVGAILVVSDEVATFKWRSGFKDSAFRQRRKAVVGVLNNLCRIL